MSKSNTTYRFMNDSTFRCALVEMRKIKLSGNPATVAPTTFAVCESTSGVPFPAEMDRFRYLFVISKSWAYGVVDGENIYVKSL